MSFVRSASTASAASSRSPEVATITGSSTTCFGDQRVSPAAMASMTGELRHHADLDGADLEIGEHRVDLRGHEIGRHLVNAADARACSARSAP